LVWPIHVAAPLGAPNSIDATTQGIVRVYHFLARSRIGVISRRVLMRPAIRSEMLDSTSRTSLRPATGGSL
jgi:hypothetical protein